MRAIVIELHGLSSKNITKDNSPFIYNFAKQHGCSALKPPFGSNIFATMWSGKKPSKCGYFTKYYFNSKSSLKYYWLFPRFIRNAAYNLIQTVKRRHYYTLLDKNPKIKHFQIAKQVHYFEKDFSEGNSFFDEIKKSDKSYIFYEHPVLCINGKISYCLGKGDNKSRIKRFQNLLKDNPSKDFNFLMLRDTDRLGHNFGPESNEVKECLKKTDNGIKQLLRQISPKNSAIFIMAGYSMVQAKSYLDIALKLPPFGKGYIYFLDSTMARFWFFDNNKKKEVMKALSGIKEGHVLSRKEIAAYGIDFKDNRFFEEIFRANAGIVINPCFFHNNKVRGMHTYGLKSPEEYGFIISNQGLNKRIYATELKSLFVKALKGSKK